jgi:ATP-dependent Clp protease ATP-binding subunit ClpA
MGWFKSFWKGFTTPLEQEDRMNESLNNLTPRAQQVLALARKEADRFNHNFVGTEHLLLGLIRLGQGVAVNVLNKMGLDLEFVRLEVEKQIGTGPDEKMLGNIPYTPRVKKVLSFAAKEASALNHTYVGTEHILLGILREGDGVAGRVLMNLYVDVEATRQHILQELDPNFEPKDRNLPLPQLEQAAAGDSNVIDTSKRYDVYCNEQNKVVVYRNALFKRKKNLFPTSDYEVFSEVIELEQSDGQTIFIARASLIKFCASGVSPGSEAVPD